MVHPKNPALFALASLIVGGLGTMLAGRAGRGIAIFGVMVFNGMLMLIPFLGLLSSPSASRYGSSADSTATAPLKDGIWRAAS
jgi:TM2 domain-containing membrane protein YozV